jgi:hypothetical protein
MPNGKPGDNPLTDLVIPNKHRSPADMEEMLGENRPFSPREFEREQGRELDDARRDLSHLLETLEARRGDGVLVR